MCRPTTCEVCGKTTWKRAAVSTHRPVKEQVPADQWCDMTILTRSTRPPRRSAVFFFGSFAAGVAFWQRRRRAPRRQVPYAVFGARTLNVKSDYLPQNSVIIDT